MEEKKNNITPGRENNSLSHAVRVHKRAEMEVLKSENEWTPIWNAMENTLTFLPQLRDRESREAF